MSQHPGHELSDAHAPHIWKFLLGLFVLIGVTVLLMLGMFRVLQRMPDTVPAPTPMEAQRYLPPAPRLQVNNTTDLQGLRANEEKLVNSYGWVDKTNGVVRLPVSRAIDLVAERGLPAKEKKK